MHAQGINVMPKPYAHGGDVYAFAAQLGIHPHEVIDFSANINPLSPSVDLSHTNITPYPDPHYHELKHAVATYLDSSCDTLEPFNGASSAIFALLRHVQPTEITLYAPLYSEYARACEVLKIPTRRINRFNGISLPKKNTTVVFVNPSTPDGTLYDMEPLLEAWKSLGVCVILDESFLDFTDSHSASSWVHDWKNLYIVRSFTKFFSCAGVRAGFLITHPDNIRSIRSTEPLWKVSSLDSAYLIQALHDKAFQIQSKKTNRANRTLLQETLDASHLFDTLYPSRANFILTRLKQGNSATLQYTLKAHRILIRQCENFDFLDHRHIRFAVKDPHAIALLSKGLS
jgi:threonine-phosphate decarboxylase